MPYCQECGSYLEQDTNICSSCGNKLIDVLQTNAASSKGETEVNPLETDGNVPPPMDTLAESETAVGVPKETVDAVKEQEQLSRGPESNTVVNGSPSEFIPQEGLSIGSHWNQVESHLGRGLIKPVAIENCMDGYHFKYDEPPRQITKPEQQQEKVVEFRFSGEPEPSEAAEGIQEIIEEEKVNREITDAVGGDLAQDEPLVESEPIIDQVPIVEPEPMNETVSEDYDSAEDNQEEIIPVAEVGLPEDDLNKEIDDMEPEIRAAAEPEVLWEGHRSWYGLALKEGYRITDQSIMILDSAGIKLKEIEWGSVTKISLKQNWFSRLLNLGNLEILGANFEPLLILEGVDHPEQLQKILEELVSPKV